MIRRLTRDDSAEMARLHRKSIAPAWPQSDMETHCDKDICLGMGDPLSAFAIFSLVQDQAEILTIVTDPEHRKKGLAHQLLAAGESLIHEEGGDIIFLEVAEDNFPAIQLYKSSAYEPFGRRPAYYRRDHGRIAALTFRKKLDA